MALKNGLIIALIQLKYKPLNYRLLCMKKNYTLFISDLHLFANEPHVTATFLYFLQYKTQEATALYILGDLFEAWVGDDDLNIFNKEIIQALKKTTAAGLRIYFMRGNRDFLVGQKFSAMTGVEIIPDPTVINLYGQRVLLMHGDSLCTADKKHQAWRRQALKPLNQKLALCLPLKFRQKIGKWLRQQSRHHQIKLKEYIMDVAETEVIKVMQAHNVKHLIHGHTHRPGFYPLILNNEKIQRMVLGDWHSSGHILACDDQLQFQFEKLPFIYC